MSDVGRRGFMQGLIALLGTAKLLGRVKPSQDLILSGLEVEADEYEESDQTSDLVTIGEVAGLATVRWNPLRFEVQRGFRYLASPTYGSARLYFKRPAGRSIVLVNAVEGDDSRGIFCISESDERYVGVDAYDVMGMGHVERDFHLIMISRPAPTSIKVSSS